MKIFSTGLVFFLTLAAFAGINPVLQNPYTTNNQTAADAHAQLVAGGNTNALSIGQSNLLTSALQPSTAGSNYILAVAQTITNGQSNANLAQLAAGTNAAVGAIAPGTNAVLGALASTNALNNAALQAGTNAAKAYADAGDVTVRSALNSTNILLLADIAATTNLTSLSAWFNTNLTAAANSYVVNFNIPQAQTNWTVTLPAIAQSYIVKQELYLVCTSSVVGNFSQGNITDCKFTAGINYPVSPFASIKTGTGVYTVVFDGDRVQMLDPLGNPGSYYAIPGFIPNITNFFLSARYTWDIHN